MNLSFLSLFVFALTSACASQPVKPLQGPHTAAAPHVTSASNEPVELRHFYVLSPGPHATLVVTSSDAASNVSGAPVATRDATQ